MSFEALIKIVTENPLTAGAIGTVLAGVIAFVKPIMRALQAALIRRIDQAWPENGGHEEKVRKTVDAVTSGTLLPLPRGLVESVVRKRKSTPPPGAE